MSKIVVLLTVYAAVVSSVLGWKMLERERQAATSSPGAAPFLDPGHASDEQVRQVLFEARKLFRDEIAETLKDIDWRLARIEALREATEEGLEAAERTATEASAASVGRLEALQKKLDTLGSSNTELEAVRASLAALSERMTRVEERPAQVVREIVREGGVAPRIEEPKRPQLPGKAQRDPAVVAAEVAKARTDIMSNELDVVFPAIEKVREHRVLDLVPRLLEILESFPEEFGRTAAAAALGRMQVADAVPALAEAVTDKSGLVAQQANKSVRQITGFDSQMSPSARVRERRTVRNRIKEWWRTHEQEVRERLGQPSGSGGGGG